MVSPHLIAHWRRVGLAAARLALFYGVGVALLLVALISITEGPRELTHALSDILLPGLILFGIAFGILGLARRAGFVALWLLLVGVWVWATTPGHMIAEGGFLAWTSLSLPLYLLAAIGIQRPVTFGIAKLRIKAVPLVALPWAALTLLAIYYDRARPYVQDGDGLRETAVAGLRPVWLAAPYIIAAFAILHVWVGLAQPKHRPPAA